MKNYIIIFLLLACVLYACKDHSTSPNSDNGSAITASKRSADLKKYVDGYHAGLQLFSVSAKNVEVNGCAARWSYGYMDTTTGTALRLTYYFHVTPTEIAFDSTAAFGTGSMVLNAQWFDSDTALKYAETYGGTIYRSQNSSVTITAMLGQALTPTSVPEWRVYYYGSPVTVGYIINANTGALIGNIR